MLSSIKTPCTHFLPHNYSRKRDFISKKPHIYLRSRASSDSGARQPSQAIFNMNSLKRYHCTVQSGHWEVFIGGLHFIAQQAKTQTWRSDHGTLAIGRAIAVVATHASHATHSSHASHRVAVLPVHRCLDYTLSSIFQFFVPAETQAPKDLQIALTDRFRSPRL